MLNQAEDRLSVELIKKYLLTSNEHKFLAINWSSDLLAMWNNVYKIQKLFFCQAYSRVNTAIVKQLNFFLLQESGEKQGNS